ncbi:OmpA/MotB family protein [Kordiimonas marina]|uniref:OmpA/MotB family protein n=1 Tax=Kordiimonas marina TaxID=2872312 RepID=UPI001FF64E39|nr:flagellar motor protein MotB [Kordiimonas marina]MCJ9430348.1 hypothetical protein [Kordiimonas marina]
MADKNTPFRQQEAAPANWMLTFADLLSLLLTFFVLMFSMSAIQFDNWKAMVRTMSDEFNPARVAVDTKPHDGQDSLLVQKAPGLNLSYLTVLIRRALDKNPLLKQAIVHRVRDNVVISIPANLLFGDKNATPTTDGVKALRQLAGSFVQVKNRIMVAGYTDPNPVKNGLFRSNWELSLTRARLVAGIMADAGYVQPVNVLGYADTRFAELSPKLGQVRRYQLAERIDIIIINEKRERGPYDLF